MSYIATDGRDTIADIVTAGANAQLWGDACSLVPGRLDNIKYTLLEPLMAPRIRAQAAVGVGGRRSLVAVNYDQRCPAGGGLKLPFTVPDGVTAIKFALAEVSTFGGVASPGPLVLQLLDATGALVLHTTSYTPTSTSFDVWTAEIPVVAGTEYQVNLVTRTAAGHAVFQCGRLRVVPTSYTDPFYANFTRVEAHTSLLMGSNRFGIDTPRYWKQSEFSFLRLRTDGDEVRAEYVDTAGLYLQSRPNSFRPAAFVLGDPIDPAPTTVARATSVVKIPLSVRGTKIVEVRGGIQSTTIYPAPHLDNIGTFLAAVYVPASASFEVITEGVTAAERVVLYGDSKISSFYTSLPASDGPAEALRRRGFHVTCHCAGGASIFADVGATVSVAACTPLARALTRGNPDRIVLQMGRNDFANTQYTPANVVTQIGNLLDAINAVSPGTRVDLLTFTREVAETDVSGTTWEAERAAIIALAASRSWVTVVDTARAWLKSQAASYTDTDTVHPNDAGYQRIVQSIAHSITGGDFAYSPLDSGTCLAYFEGADLLTGGAYGTITASGGGSPPSITLSGAPTWANQIRIAMTTGGAVGTAEFSVSFNQGRTWPIKNVKTATTVLLEGLGITIGFPAGTYTNLHVYTAETSVTQWGDKSGNGRHMVGNTNQLPKFSPSKAHGKPGVAKGAATSFMRLLGLSVPPPYSMMVVGKLLSQASVRTFIGRTAALSGPFLYANTASTVAYNDGTLNLQQNVDATVRRSYFIVVNGASTIMRVNGVNATGTGADLTLTGFGLFADGVSGWPHDDEIDFCGLWSGALAQDEMMCLEARARKLWGAV